ncbi:hypothetical protein [Streptomyces boninensis]|uniref:hypothetical protein n=1 Tax=Streptomyces boninensis TaxID=2039455 RepID=UPI003B21DCD4
MNGIGNAALVGGYLHLTAGDKGRQAGSIGSTRSFSSKLGIVAEFEYSFFYGKTYDGKYGDGMSMYLFDGKEQPSVGAPGRTLGYSCAREANKTCAQGSDPGVRGGYVGIGFDTFGNFSGPEAGDGPAPGAKKNTVTLRGAGSEKNGFPFLARAEVDESLLRAPGRQFHRARVSIIDQKLSLEIIDSQGKTHQVLTKVDLKKQGATPDSLKIGFSASTGAATEDHALRDLKVTLPVDLTIDKTGSAPAAPGQLVSYRISVDNKKGVNPTELAHVTDTVPSDLTDVTFTCQAQTGGNCLSGSSGSAPNNKINAPVKLDKGGAVVITVTGRVKSDAIVGHTIENTAEVTPEKESDINLADNTSTSRVQVKQAELELEKNATVAP